MVPADLSSLRQLYLGFTKARVVLTANNLGVFEILTKPHTAAKAAARLKADPRGVEILLDALTALGLVKKSRAGVYSNSTVSNKYLVKGERLYQGDIVRHASTMWQNFSALDEVVASGKPARKGFDHEAFIMGMHNLTVPRSEALVKAIGLKGVKTMLDLGGGPGTNAITMAKKGVKATIFDLPDTIEIARKVARREGVKGLSYIAGDFQVDGIGQGYDLVLLSQIFHAYSPEDNIALLMKCRAAMNPGARVAVHEFPIDETMTSPPHSAIFSVNMLVGTEHGRCYTPREIKGWLMESGFGKVAVKQLDETVLIIGTAKGR